MPERINADKARLLVQASAKKAHLDFFDRQIQEAATKGLSLVLITGEPYEQAVRQGAFAPSEVYSAILDLQARGFKISQYWEEGQFVDCALRIDWK